MISECSPGVINAKNPRRLHLNIKENTKLIPIEIKIGNRGFINRNLILNEKTLESLSIENKDIQILKRWLANRYSAPSFPDAFNERRANIKQKIEGHLKKPVAKKIDCMFINIDPWSEIDTDQTYETTIAFVLVDEIGIDDIDIINYVDKFKSIFDVEGINVNTTILGLKDMNLYLARSMARWDFADYYTFRQPKENPEVTSIQDSEV